MYYSSILILVVMTNLSLSGAWYPNDLPDYENTNDEVLNIGNGRNKNNVVVIEDRPESSSYPNTRSRSQSDPHGNRFGSVSSVNNIGNGYNNRNTVVFGNGDHRKDAQQHGTRDKWHNGGTVIRKGKDGQDVFNVGYGQGNQNTVINNGEPIQPDCYGGSCDDIQKTTRLTKNAAGINQAFSLLLYFLSLYLTLV